MIRCWLFKQEISHQLDFNSPLPERVQKHLRQCPSCRAFHESQVQIAEQLIATAPRHLKTPSPFLHGKIMAAIDRAPIYAGREQRIWRPGWTAGFVMLGLVVVFGLLMQHQHSRTKPGNVVATRAELDSSPSVGLEPLASVVGLPITQKLRELSQNLDQPLEAELHSVVHDAKQALHLLAQNFLPDHVLESFSRDGTGN
ncbi:MAG: hypothetical protein FJ403_15860 [Verrucomicrobia bacterium]|nr:hypothetical protein [Verrucomicrobiota bacterium]